MRDRSPLHLSQQYVFLPVKHLTIPRETGLRLTPQNLQSMDPPRPAWPCQLPTLHGTRPRAQRELVEPKAKSTLNLSMPVIKMDGWRVLSIWSPSVLLPFAHPAYIVLVLKPRVGTYHPMPLFAFFIYLWRQRLQTSNRTRSMSIRV
ncbi:hypothetical protein FRC03_011435 [Tulasnella sp. 419]|nr:hypothetical protein FRC03_011435 [Tulasnella sp. 419]